MEIHFSPGESMRDNGQIIDALVPREVSETGTEFRTTPSGIAEVAVRLLGTMLVLYRHHVPNSDYYKVHDTTI
jgi:hypothetical protein